MDWESINPFILASIQTSANLVGYQLFVCDSRHTEAVVPIYLASIFRVSCIGASVYAPGRGATTMSGMRHHAEQNIAAQYLLFSP